MKSTTAPILFAAVLMLFGCTSSTENGQLETSQDSYPQSVETIGLNTLTTLNLGSTTIELADFFNDPSRIDSVTGYAYYDIAYDKSAAQVTIKPTEKPEPVYWDLECWIDGYPWAIPMRKARKIEHTIVFDPAGNTYETVQIAGDFNGWTPANTPFDLVDGKWQANVQLNPGSYQYQYVLDGEWGLDPHNPDSIDNNNGGFNSLLQIGESAGDGAPRLNTVSVENGTINIATHNKPLEWRLFWENFKFHESQFKVSDGQLKITLPEEAKSRERSYIRVYAANEHGAANDLFIPLHNGELIDNPDKLARSDKHRNVLYFMMVDRFHNGNTSNDNPLADPEVEYKANYHGGDIAGITQKLKDGYFSDLEMNTIWLSPITQNPLEAYVEWPAPHRKYSGYHGYWPISLTKIDHRFGTDAELKELVAEAHKQDINVILDFVSNHVHEKWPLYQQHKDWATQLDLPDGRKNIRIWDEHRLTTWFDTFLPTLDHSNPEVVETMSDSAMYWLQQFDLDGFRHDATKHIPEVYWRTLTQKVKQDVVAKNGKSVFQIGETFGSRELIGSYVGSGQMDGQFDFNLYFDARNTFVSDNQSFDRLGASLQESLEFYGYHHLMGNITGNHDMPRFITYAGEGISFGEDAKEAGWERDVQVENPVGYDKLEQLTAFIMTVPGVPVLYYGDEIGMPGAGDPDNRRDMQFSDLSENEARVKSTARQLAQLRQENMALLYGETHVLQADADALVYVRQWFDQAAIVCFSRNAAELKLNLPLPNYLDGMAFEAAFGHEATVANGRIFVTLPANSFEILQAK